LTVVFHGPKSKQEREIEEKEQQKVIELQVKMRKEEEEQDRLRVSKSLPAPAMHTTEPTQVPPHNEHNSFSFQTVNSNPDNLPAEELEEVFIREAIRLSLLANPTN